MKVSNLLENKHIFPSHIVVSGNPGPRVKKKKGLYLLDNKSFIAEVKKLGGLSDEVCDNEQLMKYFMPVFRGDFEMAESGILADYEVIKAPIFAMMGSEEEDTAQIANWSNYTLSDFEQPFPIFKVYVTTQHSPYENYDNHQGDT